MQSHKADNERIRSIQS